MRSSRLLAVPVVVASIPIAVTASAQDAYTAVYDDVKQVIGTLVLKEVSQNVASRLACFTGRSELPKGCTPGTACAPNAVNVVPAPGAAHWVDLEAIAYFPQTMRLLFDGQYSSLRTTMLSEASGLAADVVYKLLTEPPVIPEASTVAANAGAPSSATPPASPSSATAPASTVESETSPEEMRKTRQREGGFGSAAIPVSSNASAPNAALPASNSGGSAPVPDIDFAPLPGTQLDYCGDQVKQQLAAHQIGAGTPPLAQECSAANKQRNVYACYLAEALQSELQGAPSDADQNLQNALVELVGEWALGTAWSVDTFSAAAPIVRTMLNADPAKVTSRDAAQTAATALLALNTSSSSTNASPPSTPPGAVPPNAAPSPGPAPSATPPKKGTKPPPASPAAKLEVTSVQPTTTLPTTRPATEPAPKTAGPDPKLVDHMTVLLDEWRVFHPTAGSKLNVATFVDAMEGTTALFRAACGVAPGAPACKVLMTVQDPNAPGGYAPSKQAKVLGAGAKMAALVGLAGRGDYVDAAQLAVEDVFQGINSQCKDHDVNGTCDEYQVYERFADSVVVYVSDIGSDGTPSQAASQAFQSAGEDLITQVANGGGIDRRQFSGGWALFVPDLSLRYSWSPSYVNNSDGTGRVLASVTSLNLRAPLYRTDYFYSALKFSFVDWIAPLAEIATRKSTNVYYGNQAALVADLFNPRIDVEVAIPALSKHLLVGGGSSYRFVVPYPASNLGTPATPTSPAVLGYQYDAVWNRASQWSQGLEFGLFAKYSM
jgi:hypothetical protein